MERLPRGAAALTGVLALVAALAAGHLVSAFVGANASPFVAVGNAAIDVTPAPVKDWAVRTFGTADKAVLLGGMAVVLVGVAVLAGLLSRRGPGPGTAIIVAFGLLGGVAVVDRPDLGQLGLLAPAASLLTGVATFRWLHTRAQPADPLDDAPGPPESAFSPLTALQGVADRRRFLVGAGGVAVGAGVAGIGGQLLGAGDDAAGSRRAIGALTADRPAPPIPAGADFTGSGTPSFITPNPDFYRIDTAFVVPQVPTSDWSLRIHGMVERELTLSYADLRARPLVERTITLCCVSNEVGGPYVSTADFIGVDLPALLAEAGVRPGAEQLFSTSEDGWTCGTPVGAVTDPARGAMLAIGMNGEPLPLEHGFPARMVVPGLYGYVSATKWIREIELTTWAARRAYWLDRGWAERAPVKTQSRIDAPTGELPAGRVVAAGIAWAQGTGIDRVEVRLDDGPWQAAELAEEVNVNTWRMWRAALDVPPGSHRLACRATDRSGYTQTAARAPVTPDGATGWHTVSFTTS